MVAELFEFIDKFPRRSILNFRSNVRLFTLEAACVLTIRLLLLIGLWVLNTGCEADPVQAPPRLTGVWSTQAEGYADQHLFIGTDRIGFGTSALAADGYVITAVEESREDEKTAYVIAYRDAEQGRYQLAFYYDAAGGGRITFKNQRHLIWTKQEAAS